MVFINILMEMKTSIQETVTDTFDFAIATDNRKLKKDLVQLGVNVNDLTCTICNEIINSDLSNLGSIWKQKGKLQVCCDKSTCEIRTDFGA